jgi:hypothetical protein
MCISLSPLNVSSPFITANRLDGSVIVSYSIMTSEDDQDVSTSYNRSRSVKAVIKEEETIYAWFLPIKDYSFADITILNLTKKDKRNIDDALDYIEAQKRQYATRSMSFGGMVSKGLSDVVTLADGSQIVRAANPVAIFDEINNVNPEYRQKLFATADIAIKATNAVDELKNSTCLVYLFKGSSKPSRDYLAYEVPFNGEGDFYLPTVENNHSTLTIDRVITRDNVIMWGGVDPNHAGAFDLELNYSDNSIIPDNVYGTFDFVSAYPGKKFANGWISINFNNEDPDNIFHDKDCDAIGNYDIIAKVEA